MCLLYDSLFLLPSCADHSIFIKLDALQMRGGRELHQFLKRSMALGVPISHIAYRCSFVPPIEAKQPEHDRQEEARPIGTMDLFPETTTLTEKEKEP